MSKPHISVVVPTHRVGGLDVLFAGLEGQTYKDFELVLSDCLYEHRKGHLKDASFPVHHLEPINNAFPVQAYCRTVNTGIAHARGEIVYLTCDYAWLEPDCLAQHARFHEQNHGVLAGGFVLHKPPPVHETFPVGRYGTFHVREEWDRRYREDRSDLADPWADAYCKDLAAGDLTRFFWSIYAEPYTTAMTPHTLEVEHDPLDFSPYGSTGNLKNDSFRRSDLLAINGLNERLDGSHNFQDPELYERLAALRGIRPKSAVNKSMCVRILEAHRYILLRKILRSELAQEDVFKAIQKEGYGTRVNTWDLSTVSR